MAAPNSNNFNLAFRCRPTDDSPRDATSGHTLLRHQVATSVAHPAPVPDPDLAPELAPMSQLQLTRAVAQIESPHQRSRVATTQDPDVAEQTGAGFLPSAPAGHHAPLNQGTSYVLPLRPSVPPIFVDARESAPPSLQVVDDDPGVTDLIEALERLSATQIPTDIIFNVYLRRGDIEQLSIGPLKVNVNNFRFEPHELWTFWYQLKIEHGHALHRLMGNYILPPWESAYVLDYSQVYPGEAFKVRKSFQPFMNQHDFARRSRVHREFLLQCCSLAQELVDQKLEELAKENRKYRFLRKTSSPEDKEKLIKPQAGRAVIEADLQLWFWPHPHLPWPQVGFGVGSNDAEMDDAEGVQGGF